MQYSIVIPVHNESSHIAALVTKFVESRPVELADVLKEIIIVENGSTDNTLEICRNLEEEFSDLVRVITIPRGSYGEAIKLGMLESRGTHLSILECDLLDWAFVMNSVSIFRLNAAEVVIGSKRHRESVDKRPLKRRILTALYNRICIQLLIGYPGTDTHGLKSVEARSARRLCDAASTSDELFQTEIVLLAWRFGMAIEEVPVVISEIRSAPVSVSRRLPKVLNTVWRLKRSLKRFPSNASQEKGVPPAEHEVLTRIENSSKE
jgi:glycosyltransferase involved in cell wall biosynthesis